MTSPAPRTIVHESSDTSRPRRLVAAAVLCVIVGFSMLFAHSGDASADAAFGVGLANITTDGFTHPWLGGYRTNAGTSWCIESGRGYPRAVGNTPTGDLPAARGVPRAQRDALAYAVWAYGSTTDPTTAAGLATVVHGLSGDDYASVDVPSMAVSSAAVKRAAVSIYHEASARSFWVADPRVSPWKITTKLTHIGGGVWDALTTITTAGGRNIVGRRVTLVPANVVRGTTGEHVFATDAAGQIHSRWTQDDPTRPISIDVRVSGPGPYMVWTGPRYPAGTIPQRVITANGAGYRSSTEGRLPTGRIIVDKTTDNPAYQNAAGAVFTVTDVGAKRTFGQLTVSPSGTSNALEVPVGTYMVAEVSAPTGVGVDPRPQRVDVTSQATATLTLRDPVERRAGLELVKVDAATGEPVAGAQLLIERDSDADGSYDDTIGTFTSTLTPVTAHGLASGRYRITEMAAPDGYELPDQPVQELSLAWDETAHVSFADHRTVVVATRARVHPPTSTTRRGTATADAVGRVGDAVGDTVTVAGVAPGEAATVEAALYGPATPGGTFVCDAAHRVYSGGWEVTGSGDSDSQNFTPTTAGAYTWVATVRVPGLAPVSGTCGEASETVTLTPTVTTRTVPPPPDSTGPVTDQITVTGLAEGTHATVDTELFGPFSSPQDLAAACVSEDLGQPVGVAHDAVAGTGTVVTLSSSPIELPADAERGYYTFVATLDVAGFSPISHDCGDVSETFTYTPPTTTTTTTTTTTAPSALPPTTIPKVIPPPRRRVPTEVRGAAVIGGTLPRTGAPTDRLVATGVAVTLIGTAVLLLVARRRLVTGT